MIDSFDVAAVALGLVLDLAACHNLKLLLRNLVDVDCCFLACVVRQRTVSVRLARSMVRAVAYICLFA